MNGILPHFTGDRNRWAIVASDPPSNCAPFGRSAWPTVSPGRHIAGESGMRITPVRSSNWTTPFFAFSPVPPSTQDHFHISSNSVAVPLLRCNSPRPRRTLSHLDHRTPHRQQNYTPDTHPLPSFPISLGTGPACLSWWSTHSATHSTWPAGICALPGGIWGTEKIIVN